MAFIPTKKHRSENGKLVNLKRNDQDPTVTTGTSQPAKKIIDTEVFIPTKIHRSENGKSVNSKGNDQDPTVTTSQPAKKIIDTEVSDSHSDLEVDIPPVLEHSNSHTHSIHGHDILDTPAEAIQGPKHAQARAATQLKEGPKARITFASARIAPNSKPFVPLDPASIRRGFREGGASSKKEDLKKGTYIMPINMAKTIQLILAYSYSFCLRGDSVFSPSSNCLQGSYV